MAYSCSFSQGGNLDFLDLLQKIVLQHHHSNLLLLFFLSDDRSLSNSEHRDLHNENLASGDRIRPRLWSTYAQNLEVRRARAQKIIENHFSLTRLRNQNLPTNLLSF